ncbi:MAG: LolA family protein [Solirubrobacteraceae bacterium]
MRTATTGRLLAALGGVVAAIVIGAAVAVAATSGGPVPKRQSLSGAIHQALRAPAISGISARVTFTNNLVNSSEIQGSDPLLNGGTGRLWMSSAGHALRLEVQGQNGDAQVVVHGQSFWMYDPTSQTAYEGTLPAQSASGGTHTGEGHHGIPSVAQIQTALNRIVRHVQLSHAIPGDIAGQPAYTVRITPKQSGGRLRGFELGWDAVRGVPLRFEVLARGDSTPVLELTATDISFAKVPASTFAISPPKGAKVVQVNLPAGAAEHHSKSHAKNHTVTGVAAVARAVQFKLAAPGSAAGLHRSTVALLHGGSHAAALVTYGQGLGAVAVLEQGSGGASAGGFGGLSSGGSDSPGLSVPTVSINGTTGQELDTALGSVIRFTRDHVAYTVLGSVPPAVARAVARGL